MNVSPNIQKIFLIGVVLTLSLTCCERNSNDPIPDVYVNFTIDLNKIEFNSLVTLGNSAIVTRETNNFGSRAAGYDNNGILIYRSLNDEFLAFDRTCPHCYAESEASIIIETEDSFSQEAICPVCGTVYSLDMNGMPEEGPGRYYLKDYKTQLSEGRYLTVWNNK